MGYLDSILSIRVRNLCAAQEVTVLRIVLSSGERSVDTEETLIGAGSSPCVEAYGAENPDTRIVIEQARGMLAQLRGIEVGEGHP